jgi:hypothetical protein
MMMMMQGDGRKTVQGGSAEGDSRHTFARGGLGALLGRLGGASRRGAGVGSPHDDDDVLNYRVG